MKCVIKGGIVATVALAEFAGTVLACLSAGNDGTRAVVYLFIGLFVMLWTILLGVSIG